MNDITNILKTFAILETICAAISNVNAYRRGMTQNYCIIMNYSICCNKL